MKVKGCKGTPDLPDKKYNEVALVEVIDRTKANLHRSIGTI